MTSHVSYRLLVRLLVPGLVLGVLALRTVSPACANIFGKDDRKEVVSQDYPYCCIGLVEGKVPGGTTHGTGFLVGRNLAISNNHCTMIDGKPIERMYFGAGLVKGSPAKVSRVRRVHRGGANFQQDRTQDWAVLELEDNLGDELGWLPLTDELPETAELIGYSGDMLAKLKSATRSMATILRELHEGVLQHDADATRGSSGGPLVALHQGRPHVVALNFGEFRNGDESMKVGQYDEQHANLAIPVSVFLPQVGKIIADEAHNEFCNAMKQLKAARRKGDKGQMLLSLGDAIRLQPDNFSVRITRAQLLLEEGAWQEALDDLAEAGRLEPDDHSLSMMRAKTMFEHKQYEECALVLNKLLEQKPDHEDALALQGKAYLMLVLADVRKSLGH